MVYLNEETYKRINEAIIRWKYYDDFEAYRKENGYEEEMYCKPVTRFRELL